MSETIQHAAHDRQFVCTHEGVRSVLHYQDAGPTVLDYSSTFVPPEIRNRGVGSRLVRHALDYARDAGYTIRPSCWFVAEFIERHHEYRDLVANED
jgi:predicted GNAT family acetyltransferase